MKQNSILKYLVPLAAMVVLVESVIMISNLQKKTQIQPIGIGGAPVELVKVYDIQIRSDQEVMKVGDEAMVSVSLVGSEDKSIDAFNLFIKYNTDAFTVSDLVFGQMLPKPSFSKISDTKKLVIGTFLITEPEGLAIAANQKIEVMAFKITAKKQGSYSFEIDTGADAKESATMMVDNVTNKPIGYGANKLVVNVEK